MIIQETTICGLVKVCPSPIIDERGYFMRTYDESIFKKSGLQSAWKQENQSLSNQEGIVRGLHFQRVKHQKQSLFAVFKVKFLMLLWIFVSIKDFWPTLFTDPFRRK